MSKIFRLSTSSLKHDDIVIFVFQPLESKESKDLEAALKGFLQKGESLLLETRVDPSIIGGMQVNIGDKYIDMSMASKIKAYSSLIRETL